ncbi:MAG: FtsB family cell division protein [Candidatus Puniceispirillaceae bacterium]
MVSQFRKGIAKSSVFFTVGTIACFFGFHTFAGERGMLARGELDRQIVLAQEELALLEKQNAFLAQRIDLMRSGQVDSDILTETARAELGLYAPDDVIITIDLQKLKF